MNRDNDKPMITAFVVVTAFDVEKVQAEHKNETLFLASNWTVFQYCKARHLQAIHLSEAIVCDHYAEINTWAFSETFKFLGRFSPETLQWAQLNSNFMWVQSAFAQGVKHFLTLNHLISRSSEIRKVRVFDSLSAPFLSILVHYFRLFGNGIDFEVIPDKRTGETPARTLKQKLYRGLGRLANALALFRLKKAGDRRNILASGALNHLGSVLDKLKTTHPSLNVFFCENSFNLEKFLFCLRRNYFFLILDPDINPLGVLSRADFDFSSAPVIYRGTDLSSYLSGILASIHEAGRLQFPMDYQTICGWLKDDHFSAFLMDEEWALRRIFLSAALQHKKPSFVISHGIPGLFLKTGDKASESMKNNYLASVTFINSGFEKEQYENIYYSPSLLRREGTPRYDRIAEILRSAPGKSLQKKGRLQVLFCGASMAQFDAGTLIPWLGTEHFYDRGSKVYLRDVIELLSRMAWDIDLIIKPHYREEKLWQQALQEVSLKNINCRIVSHRKNIFSLLSESDLVISTESTVVCEAIIFEKHAVVLNYETPSLMVPYDKSGRVAYVQNRNELERVLKECLSSSNQGRCVDAAQAKKPYDYFAGPLDGRNTERVALHLASVCFPQKEQR